MQCNSRPPEPRQPLPALMTTPCQFEVSEPIHYCGIIAFLLLIYYFTLWPWSLAFDLEHLQRIACDVMKLCTEFERNRAIRGRVCAISVFDLMTLNIALHITLGAGIIFTKFELRQLIRAWIIALFWCWYVISRCDLDLWPVDLESLWYIKRHMIKVSTKFEQNRAMPGWIIDNFANFCTRCHAVPWPLTSWPWTFRALRASWV